MPSSENYLSLMEISKYSFCLLWIPILDIILKMSKYQKSDWFLILDFIFWDILLNEMPAAFFVVIVSIMLTYSSRNICFEKEVNEN